AGPRPPTRRTARRMPAPAGRKDRPPPALQQPPRPSRLPAVCATGRAQWCAQTSALVSRDSPEPVVMDRDVTDSSEEPGTNRRVQTSRAPRWTLLTAVTLRAHRHFLTGI